MQLNMLRLCALAQFIQPASRSMTRSPTSTDLHQHDDFPTESESSQLMTSDDTGVSIPESLEQCQIYQWLRNGEFWSKDFVGEILPQIKIEFGPELQYLKTAKTDRKGVGNGRNDTFAMQIFGGEDGTFVDEEGVVRDKATTYYEIDRTLTAVRALLWIRNGEVDIFNPDLSRAQAEAVKRGVSEAELPWSWIRANFQTKEANVFLKEQAHICYALITSVIINDVGKDPHLPQAYQKATGHELQPANHDAYLRACIDAGMIPSFDRLPRSTREAVMLGIEVAAECNLGQTAQGENLPASLYPLVRFRDNYTAWRLRFMEQILDLAGARGHIDNNLAVVFGPAVALGNRNCHRAAEQVLRGDKPRMAYDRYLQSKYNYLVSVHGYQSTLDVQNPSHRALMRLFCLTGCSNREMAELIEHVLLQSEHTKHFRDDFIAALDEDGIKRPAVQVTYLPALLDGVLRSEWSTKNELKRGLAAAFEYANRCYHVDDTVRDQWRLEGITVMERDIFDVSQWVRLGHGRQSDFVKDPSRLVHSALPELVMVNKVELGFDDDFLHAL